MFISKTCYDEILNHYRNCGPCSRVWQTRIIDLSSYLPYRCFIDETKPDESIDVRKNLSIFFFCGIFDAREDTAVRVSSRRTVVPNYFSVLVCWEILQRLTCSRASEAYIVKRRRNSKMPFRLSQSF